MYRLHIIIAMVSFGTLGVFVKHIPLSSAEISMWRAIIACMVLLLYVIGTNRWSHFRHMDKRKLARLSLSGVAMGFNWIFLFEAYRYTSVALSTLTYYFAPTIVVIASAVFFKERLNTRQIICFLASTAGIVLIIGVSGGGSDDMVGILHGLAAALLYATVVMSNKATGKVDGISRTWLQFVAAAIVLVPYVAITGGYGIPTVSTSGLLLLLTIGVIHTGIMYVLYFTALSHVKGQQAAILSYFDPVVAVLLSVFALGEHISLSQMAGGALILIATAVNEMGFRKR